MRILVVEEEPRVRSFLARAFVAEGLEVDQLGNRELALGYAHAHHFDLMVVALGFSDADRLRLLARFHEQLPDLPVIVLSESADLPTKLKSFELGAVDYLVKPFAIAELLARARVHLHHAAGTGMRLKAAGLTLDEHTREASIGERVVSLSDREFRVLQHLLMYQGQVVSRQRLLSSVWGYDFDPQSNVVDVCVRRLRQRLGPDAPIETVRNAGYRVVVGLAEREALGRAAGEITSG
jgi:two-component system, OmpR family, copper resistance phosphate regulon response regulator CusR